jgi:hypothetical protein
MNAKQLPAEILQAKKQAETLVGYYISAEVGYAHLWRHDHLGWRLAHIFASHGAALAYLESKLPSIPNTRGDRHL